MHRDVGIAALLHDPLFGGEMCPRIAHEAVQCAPITSLPCPWLIATCNWLRTDTRFLYCARFIPSAFLNAYRQVSFQVTNGAVAVAMTYLSADRAIC
jgi:hypothetical protein